MTSTLAPQNPKRIYIQEVVTRDGFQAESAFVPTEQKIALLNRLSRAGYAKIEVTSFTSPKAIPMLADAEAVMVPNKTHVCTYAGKWFSRSHSSDQSDRGAAYTKTPLA